MEHQLLDLDKDRPSYCWAKDSSATVCSTHRHCLTGIFAILQGQCHASGLCMLLHCCRDPLGAHKQICCFCWRQIFESLRKNKRGNTERRFVPRHS